MNNQTDCILLLHFGFVYHSSIFIFLLIIKQKEILRAVIFVSNDETFDSFTFDLVEFESDFVDDDDDD